MFLKRIGHALKKTAKAVYHVGAVAVPAVAGALGLSTEPEALINVAVSFGLKKWDKFGNYGIPAANVLVGAGVALAQGMSPEEAIAAGVKRAIIALGAHSGVKNALQQPKKPPKEVPVETTP